MPPPSALIAVTVATGPGEHLDICHAMSVILDLRKATCLKQQFCSELLNSFFRRPPFEHCDVVTTRTYKSLRCLSAGIIFMSLSEAMPDIKECIDMAVLGTVRAQFLQVHFFAGCQRFAVHALIHRGLSRTPDPNHWRNAVCMSALNTTLETKTSISRFTPTYNNHILRAEHAGASKRWQPRALHLYSCSVATKMLPIAARTSQQHPYFGEAKRWPPDYENPVCPNVGQAVTRHLRKRLLLVLR